MQSLVIAMVTLAMWDWLSQGPLPRARSLEPTLRERMVRVAFAPSDDELATALDEEEAMLEK